MTKAKTTIILTNILKKSTLEGGYGFGFDRLLPRVVHNNISSDACMLLVDLDEDVDVDVLHVVLVRTFVRWDRSEFKRRKRLRVGGRLRRIIRRRRRGGGGGGGKEGRIMNELITDIGRLFESKQKVMKKK